VSFLEHLDAPAGAPVSASAKIAAMLEHPTLAVAAIQKGRVRRANATWDALFALRSNVSVEPHLVTLFPSANSADRFERGLAAEFANKAMTARIEHMLLRRDGAAFMAEVVVHLLDGADSEHALSADAVWQVRDITAERELRREVRELEEYYRALSTYQWDLTFVVDRKDCISFASPSVETALGYRPHAILGEPFATILEPESASAGMQWLRSSRQVQGDRPRDSFRLRVAHRDGGHRVLSCRLRNCLDVPRIAGVVINARDVTEEVHEEQLARLAHERAVRLREHLFDLATAPAQPFDERIHALLQATCDGLDTSSASFWQASGDWSLLECHYSHRAAVLASSAAQVEDLVGHRFDPSESAQYEGEMRTSRPIVVDDVRHHTSIGTERQMRLEGAGVTALLDFPVALDGRLVGMVSVNQAGGPREWKTEEIDFAGGISLLVALAIESREREEAAQRTTFLALHDGLTGLFNRTHAEHDLERRIAEAQARDESLVVAMIDLDLFKEVNDGYGHAMGDALLIAVAKTLVETAGPDALVARMGGDEFLVAYAEVRPNEGDEKIQQMLDRIGGQPLVGTIEQQVGASIGVARSPANGADAQSLLLHADIAMYEAKSRGRSQAFAFNNKLAEKTRLQRELDTEIQDSLASNEFCMFYQPQVDLASGALIGLEALLRWEHPKRGLLLPDAFMGAALHRGMIEPITKWVLTQVCEQIVAWRRAGDVIEFPVSVNVTGRQFHDRRLPATVASALMKTALPARMLILEVTEESLVGNDVATERVVKELSRLGVRIAIGDFGLGYASLDHLRRLVVSQIKLDRGFVSGLPNDAGSGVIVTALVEIAKRLKYQVIAEGVETREQVEYLRAVGCEAGQGFYFGAPLSAHEIRVHLRDQHPFGKR
jgi:diguanylate cyclase (GGDEF)-like protein/PAS domain S-box-containing protein